MKRVIVMCSAAFALILGGGTAAAAPLTYEFTVTSGAIVETGAFGFDSSIIPVGGGPLDAAGLLDHLAFHWAGIDYDETTANTGELGFDASGALAGVLFGNNCGAGSCISASNSTWWIVSTSTFVYEASVIGTVAFQQVAVAEPATTALLLFGIAGVAVRRRQLALRESRTLSRDAR